MNCDLNVYLYHKDKNTGNEVLAELLTDAGGPVDDFIDTTLDDADPDSINDAVTPCTGTFRPEGRLADFFGMDAQGDWELRITDDQMGDTGRLESWSPKVESCDGPCIPGNPEPAMDELDVPRNVVLSWQCTAVAGTTYEVDMGLTPDTMTLRATNPILPGRSPGPLADGTSASSCMNRKGV